jgi:type IV pilus assembly protein PilN
MRLDINLASQPYEDGRQFWMRWGTAVGAVGLLTLVLLALDLTGWVNARRDRAAIADKKAMIADRDKLRASAEEFLNRQENRTTRDMSQYLNGLIERKAFSWTRVLENLEKVMPAHVHLISIAPQLDEDNQLGLKMSVAGDSSDRAIELASRMEESRRFAQTHVKDARTQTSTTGDTEQADIEAVYIPEPPPAGPAAQKLEKKSDRDAKPADTQDKAPEVKPNKPVNRPANKPASKPNAASAPGGQL